MLWKDFTKDLWSFTTLVLFEYWGLQKLPYEQIWQMESTLKLCLIDVDETNG